MFKFALITLFCFFITNCDATIDQQVSRNKRSGENEDKTIIICEGETAKAVCPSETSVNVTSAEYGKISSESICTKPTLKGRQLCRSPDALKRAQKKCGGKESCTMIVSETYLGRPIRNDGLGCDDVSKYLKLTFTCVNDCKRPKFFFNTESVGGSYAVGSSVQVQCREGYQRDDGRMGVVRKRCMADQTWVGPEISCKDLNECSNPSTNRCHRFAQCHNTRGSYSCTCLNGYHGDGITCTSDSWFKEDDWSDAESNRTGTTIDDDWDQAVIEVHDETICGKRIIKSRQGVLKSPLSPLNYPSNTKCIWIVAVPPGLIVELRFMRFDLERAKRGEGCSNDNMTLYDGLNKDPRRWLGTHCGDELPPTIKSQTNKVRIEFRSDDVGESKGFEIRFSAINLNFACLNFPAPSYAGIVIMNGTRNTTTQPRKSIEVGCSYGYTMTSHRNVRTCLDDGKWNDDTNPCTPVSCGRPQLPIDAIGLVVKAEPSRFRFGEIPVRYDCEPGYRKYVDEGHDDVISCGRNGRWSNERDGVIPWCEEITCLCHSDVTCVPDDGEQAPHKALRWAVSDHEGTIIRQPAGRTMSYGSQIEYSCAEGFVLTGDPLSLCTDSGWSGKRTSCEETPIAGLTNYQIAIIASAASGGIIIIIAIALIVCCCFDHRKKSKKRKKRRMRAARDNDGFVMNLAMAGNDDFLYGNTVDRRHRGFAGRHNNIRKYQERPYVLPSSGVTNARPVSEYVPRRQHDATPQRHYPVARPTSVIPPARAQPQYSVEIRPNLNRTFRPNDTNIRRPPQRTPSVTKVNAQAPPPGYMDPPPSYETMVREGYSNKHDKRKHRRRLI